MERKNEQRERMRRGRRKREGHKNDEEQEKEKQWGQWTGTGMSNGDTDRGGKRRGWGEKMCVFQSRRLQCANHKLCLEHNGVLHNCSIAAPPPPPMKARSLTPNMNTNKHVCLLSGCPGRSPLLWDTFSNNPCKQFSPECSRLWWGYFLSHRYFFARHAIATGCICFRDWLEFPYLHCCGSIAGDP